MNLKRIYLIYEAPDSSVCGRFGLKLQRSVVQLLFSLPLSSWSFKESLKGRRVLNPSHHGDLTPRSRERNHVYTLEDVDESFLQHFLRFAMTVTSIPIT
ncbi:unnamed protein product [Pleuronectes platessa]|uniref:Uncharacterized protein n=1 Tax=Pleuronectes platessa TaxID=8262 RepID=A0A9N7TZD7_PLEPL|nr:unnamed protein product [Pleuronectes platessa]